MSHYQGQLWASRRGSIVHYTYGHIFLENKPSVTEMRLLLDNNGTHRCAYAEAMEIAWPSTKDEHRYFPK